MPTLTLVTLMPGHDTVGYQQPKARFEHAGQWAPRGISARRELFPHALVYGADIDRDILFEEDRIKTFYCNQLDSVSNYIWKFRLGCKTR